MAELIRKDKLIDWSYREPTYYDSMNDRTDMRDFINGLPTTTEAEIRAKAYDKVCNAISNLLSGDTKHLEGGAYYKELAYIEVLRMVEQLKEE